MRVVVNAIVFVVGVLAGIWLAMQFIAHLFEGRFNSVEQRTEAIQQDTEQVKLALGCMIQDLSLIHI